MAHLTGKGVDPKLVIEAGLSAESDRGGAPYDRFRGRIIFPIRDGRNRPIGLGGRSLDPNARAKYLNSPETPLFDKGRSLYNHGPAREAAGKGQPLIVAEGYMDVIALSEAGFGASVAPLGTAVTEDQLRLLWRISPEPIIALDGDTAGLRAAMRVIDIALPLLEAGSSLRFALMPEGLDPDDLIKAQGKGAMQALLDGAIPMVQLLWRRETEGKIFDSPERRAALDKTLREKIKLIADPSVRSHYGEAIKELRWELFNTRKQGGTSGGKRGPKRAWTGKKLEPWQQDIAPVTSSKMSELGAGVSDVDHLREAVILATLLHTPAVILAFEAQVERMECRDPLHATLRNAVLRHATAENVKEAVVAEVGAQALEKLMSNPHLAITPSLRRAGDVGIAKQLLAEELGKLMARRGHMREISDGMDEMYGIADESTTWRLARAAASIDTSVRKDVDNSADFERAKNGVELNKDERSAFQSLLNALSADKKTK